MGDEPLLNDLCVDSISSERVTGTAGLSFIVGTPLVIAMVMIASSVMGTANFSENETHLLPPFRGPRKDSLSFL